MLRSIVTQLYEGLRFIRIANQHKYCIYSYLISRQRLVMVNERNFRHGELVAQWVMF
jgi:hypothetical protein